MVDDTEMRITKAEAVLGYSDDGKIVADSLDVIDGSSVVIRTATGVRISAQLGEETLEGIVGSNGSKSDPFGVVPVITIPAKDEVIGDESVANSVTVCDGFGFVNKEIVESVPFKEASLEIRVKEETDLRVENRVLDQEEEMIIDSIERSVLETVSKTSGYESNEAETELHVENPVVAQGDEMTIDSIEKSVAETVSRGLDCERVNVKVKEEPDLGGTKLEEESFQEKYDSVFSKKDEVIRSQEGQPIHGLSRENEKIEQEIDPFLSEYSDSTSAKRRKMEMQRSVPTDVKSCTMEQKPLQVSQVKPEILDIPEVIEVESENRNPLEQAKSYTHESAHVKMEPVGEMKVDAVNLSLQVKETKYSSEQKPVYVKKAPVDAKRVKVEDGDFPVEKDWYLVGRSLVTATSTSKGRKLGDNEVVNFTFPSTVNWKVPNIVRFSTKRCGEVSHFCYPYCKDSKFKLFICSFLY